MEDYVRLCDAADSADPVALESARKALEARVLGEAKTITKYINVPLTTPFAIMYLATEGLYAEITSSRSGISEKIQSEFNVMIAGPSTITALLNSLSLGFRAVAINEKANEVRVLLAAAKVQYDKFGTVLQKARQKIDEAGKSLDEADKRNEIIRKKLRNVEEIDGVKAEEILSLEENSDI
jgi:DNA recombination protein RmuC